MQTDNETRVRQGQHYRGQSVHVHLNDGSTYTGTINGWGPQILSIRPTDGGRRGWKVESYSFIEIDRVTEVR